MIDCRLFWSADERFLEQFKEGDISTKFQPFSKYPPVFKDMAFWITPEFTENNLAEIVRNAGESGCQ
jgi:phenylalanyl-tRNA synthetase alpha chain